MSGPAGIGFAIPGDLETISGGYAYDRRLIAEAAALGRALQPIRLTDAFPDPSVADLAETRRRLAAHPGPLLIDGLAFGAFDGATAAAVGGRTVALVHHPLCLEDGLSAARAAILEESERAALAQARGVVVTSRATARLVAEMFGVPPERIAVAEPGVDRAPRSAADGDPPTLLAVGAVIPRKGYDLLIAALSRLADAPWRLEIVGPTGRAPEHESALRAAVAAAGLEGRVRFAGALPPAALDRAYASADLFIAPARFEGYGMAAAEALVRGLPVVAGRGGALGDTAAAGVLVDPEDAEGFAAALRPLLADKARRRAAAERSWRAGAALPRWSDTASRALAALERFLD
ncbi:MAG: glycosyltransferase [Pseudomonadota bacterium]